MSNKKEELVVIMPVYNEENAIINVIHKWTKELNRIGMNYQIHTYNDGSKDRTLEILNDIASNNQYLAVHDKKNTGHGPTILSAYQEHIDKDWIFQTDSDDEMSSEYFKYLWGKRNDYDFLIGKRDNRSQPIPRKIISFISRITVGLFYGKGIWDVNSPYRLIRTTKLRDIIFDIPKDTFAPNVIICGMVCLKKLRVLEILVPHQNRQTGEVSIKKFKLFKAAFESFVQTVKFRFVKG